MFTVHFVVTVTSNISDNEQVFVVGSDAKLGNWNPHGALRLTKSPTAVGQWAGTIVLEKDAILKFRYFTGFYLESGEANREPFLIISKWETHLTPRSVLPAVEASKTRECRANVNDIFGFHGGREVLSNGWILNEEQNAIILTVSGAALKFYKSRHIQQEYRLKIVPMDLRIKNELAAAEGEEPEDDDMGGEDAREWLYPSHSTTQIAPLTHNFPMLREQGEHGELFHNSSDYFFYQTHSMAVEYLVLGGFITAVFTLFMSLLLLMRNGLLKSFRVEVYAAHSNELFAIGYAMPSTLHDTFGKASVPLQSIKSKGIPVGKLYFGYLFVRQLRLPHPPQTMAASYSRHWKKRSTLEVGHRGMGNSYTKCAVARENTLHSLNEAVKNGADMVEFDVHLSKDRIAIIFHDFHVVVTVAKRSPSIVEENSRPVSDASSVNSEDEKVPAHSNSVDFYQLAVKDLKLNQLRLLHLDHVTQPHKEKTSHDNQAPGAHSTTTRMTGSHDEGEEHRPFPTLDEVLQSVSEEVGFNVEVKYPMMQADGQHECESYFERNDFVDTILAGVLNNAGRRRIVFSSFDPDICTMLSLKQNKYPVLFLCIGDSTRHIAYVDGRTSTSMTAVKFAAGTGLIGVNFNSEEVLRDPQPIHKAKEFGLITFVWGEDLMERKNVDYFKKTLLVEGVIYDRIGEGETRSNVFSLEKQMKAALFTRKTSPQTQPRSSSIAQLSNNEKSCEHRNEFAASDGLETAREKMGMSAASSEWPPQVLALRAEDEVYNYRMRRHNSSGNTAALGKVETRRTNGACCTNGAPPSSPSEV